MLRHAILVEVKRKKGDTMIEIIEKERYFDESPYTSRCLKINY